MAHQIEACSMGIVLPLMQSLDQLVLHTVVRTAARWVV
jgi:hypothetical protein